MQLVSTRSKYSRSGYESRAERSCSVERATSRRRCFRKPTSSSTSDVKTFCPMLTVLCSAPAKSTRPSEALVKKWLTTFSARRFSEEDQPCQINLHILLSMGETAVLSQTDKRSFESSVPVNLRINGELRT